MVATGNLIACLVHAFYAENMPDLELIPTKEISADFGPLITYQ